MKLKSIASRPEHQTLLADMKGVLRKYEALDPMEWLAIVSVLVGQLVAVQDQRRYTSDQVMALVAENIQRGNQNAVADILGDTKGTA